MHLELPLLVTLLVAAVALAIGAKRLRVPYNVALVLGGMLLAVSGVLPTVPRLSPDTVFLICLPLLLFEGGITADLGNVRSNAVPIAVLATLGMVLAISATAVALRLGLALAWGPALVLGAILAVTDTVSILYAFRRAPVPTRLAGIMQGESLFNDGTALVAYGAITAALAGGEVSAPAVVAKLVAASAGGFLIGVALGLVAGLVMARTHDPFAEIMVTTAVAFAGYTAAEQLHVSGAIAAVTAGLAVGVTLRRRLPPQSQVAIHSFWDYAAFGVNTFLFLSVGLSTSLESLQGHWPQTLVALVAVFAGRAVAIYTPFLLMRLVRPAESVPVRWQHVFVIGNIKGALSIGLALGLPADVPDRQLIVDVAFGVTFISLVAQGPFLGFAMKKLGLTRVDPVAERAARHQASLIAARAAQAELDVLHRAGMVPRAGYDALRGAYQVEAASSERELRRLSEQHLGEGARLLVDTRRRLLDAERNAIIAARGAGLIPDGVAEDALAGIDARILGAEHALESAAVARPQKGSHA